MGRVQLARLLPLATLFLPAMASAQVGAVSRIVGVFNIFVGLMLTISLLLYGVGFIMWWIRLGSWPTYRTDAVRIMEWSVAILFTLVVLLGIVQFFQKHPHGATYVLSFIIVVAIIWVVVYLASHSGEKEEKA